MPNVSLATCDTDCNMDCIDCEDIDGLSGSNISPNPPGTAYGFHCTLVEHQIQWYGFVAASEDLTLEFAVSNCQGNANFEIIILAGIDCENFQVVSNCFGASTSLTSGEIGVVSNTVPLVVGQYYWLVFDATNSNGGCDFDLTVTEGATGAVPITDEPDILGPDAVCVDEAATFTIENDVFGAPEFNWYLDTFYQETGESFDFTTSVPGTYTICAEGASYCEVGPRRCISFDVNEHSEGEELLVICDPDCVDYEGQNFCDGGFYDVVTENMFGCDSLVELSLYEVAFELALESGECTEQGVELFLDPVFNIAPNPQGAQTVNWLWYINGSPVPSSVNENPFYATFNANYSVQMDIELFDNLCTESVDIDIDINDFAYVLFPTEFWGASCEGDTVIYSINTLDLIFPDQFTVFWEIPDDANMISGQSSPDIEIDWTGSMGGQICYTVINPCVTSETLCYPISVTQSPIPDIISIDSICYGESINLASGNIDNGYTEINWLIDTLANLDSGILTDPDPIDLSWDQEGTYQVELMVDYGCGPVSNVKIIEVLEDPGFSAINCFENGDVITLDWDDIPDIEIYNIESIIGPPGVLNGSSYEVSNLSPGDTIQLIISAEGFCNTIESDTATCILPLCAAIDLTIENLFPDTICLTTQNELLDFDASELNEVSGSGLFSGPGIVDELEGTFDLDIAGSGEHTVTYTFSYQDSLCTASIQDVVLVLDEPQFDLTNDLDILCIGEILELEINGLGPYDTIDYSMDNANIITDNGAGGYELSWDTPGLKTILINIDNKYCGPFTEQIQVEVQALPLINLNCAQSTSNSLSFDWDVNAIYDNYEIYVNGNLTDVITDGTYALNNLTSSTDYDIQIIPVTSNSVCPVVPETLTCSTNNCVAVQSQITTPSELILCGQGSFDPIQFNLEFDDTNFDGSQNISWNGPNTSSTGIFDPANLASGDYQIMSILSYYDCEYFDTTNVTIDIVPILELNAAAEICIEDEWTLDYTGDDLGFYTFSWTNLPIGADGSSLGPHQVNFDVPGLYTVMLNAESQNCQAEEIEISVLVQDSARTPQLNCTVGSDFIDLSWNIENSDCNGDYTIIVDGNIISDGQIENSIVIDNLSPDTQYDIEVINSSDCLCNSKSSLLSCITDNCPLEELEVSSEVQLICLDGNDQFIQLSALLNGSEINNDLSWVGQGVDQNGMILVDDNFSDGQIEYQVTYQNGLCSYFADINLEFVYPILPEFSVEDSKCPEDIEGIVFIDNVNDAHSYFIDGVEIDPYSPHHLEIGSHIISLLSDGVCLSTTEFQIFGMSSFNFDINGPEALPWGETGNFSLDTDPGVFIDSIIWAYSGNELTAMSPDIMLEESTQLCAKIFYNNGCFHEICTELRLLGANVYIPNVFSKNPNSPNNTFKLFSNDEGIMVESLQLFDRWGTLLFLSENKELGHPELEWDGTFRGKKLPAGVYVYVAHIELSNGKKQKIIGDITLLD